MSTNAVDYSKYVMYLQTVQSNAIRTLSEALKEVLMETNIHFDENGIRILTMDTTKTAFVHLKLEAPKFDTYHCPQQICIGLSLASLNKLLKTINNTDIITMFIERGDEEKLGIRIENKEKKIVSTSKLKLIDLDIDAVAIPNTTFEMMFQMQCIDFQKHCRDLSVISEFVNIYTKHNGDTFILSSPKGGFAEQEIEIAEPRPENIDDTEPVFIGQYMIKFLNLFCKSSSLCPMVQIYLKENFPLILVYSVSGLGTIKLGLSPKSIVD